MKTTTKKLLCIIPMIIFGSCSKNENGSDLKSSNTNNAPAVTVQIAKIDYPGGGAYTRDDEYFTYKDSKLFTCQYSSYGTIVTFKHPSDNIIESERIEEMQGAIAKYNTSYVLDGNRIKYVIRDTYFKYDQYPKPELKRDSIAFIFEGEYLARKIMYSKGNTTSFTYFKNYTKVEETILVWENGNIINIKFSETNTFTRETYHKEFSYQYDKNPHIEYGELAYETPFDKVRRGGNPLVLHGKLGRWNKNNVISMVNTVGTGDFKRIDYEERIVQNNKLTKIFMSGENGGYHHKGVKFKRIPVVFSYQFQKN